MHDDKYTPYFQWVQKSHNIMLKMGVTRPPRVLGACVIQYLTKKVGDLKPF